MVLAKQDLDPRSPQVADTQEIEIESSPVIAHLADGTDRIFVGMDVNNDANVGRTGLPAGSGRGERVGTIDPGCGSRHQKRTEY